MSSAPRAFISYCWSTPDHEKWVLKLASELRSSGVDAVLDKWDLREGHDSVSFMEKMVTDPTIGKVLIVCDRVYSAKADSRTGGVGTETQIITGQIYKSQDQEKFVALIVERDETGQAYIPAYYSSRIYIDLSDPAGYSEGFEQLLRCIYGRPQHQKPELGKPPSYITEPDSINLSTSPLANRAIDALRNGRGFSIGATQEYLERLATSLEKFRLPEDTADDDLIVRSISDFLPYRDEVIRLMESLARYGNEDDYSEVLHNFLERLVPYTTRPQHVTSYTNIAFDNFCFIVHELFLYTIATLVSSRRFKVADYLFKTPFVAPSSDGGGIKATDFTRFHSPIRSLLQRNQRLNLRRLSLRADLLKQRSSSSGIPFQRIMEADFICFLRSELHRKSEYMRWFPDTLLYSSDQYSAFDTFLRSSSKSYLPNM